MVYWILYREQGVVTFQGNKGGFDWNSTNCSNSFCCCCCCCCFWFKYPPTDTHSLRAENFYCYKSLVSKIWNPSSLFYKHPIVSTTSSNPQSLCVDFIVFYISYYVFAIKQLNGKHVHEAYTHRMENYIFSRWEKTNFHLQ